MNNYQQITIPVPAGETRDILLALLADAGYEGFTEERDRLQAYIPEAQFEKETLVALLAPYAIPYAQELVAQQNWNASWESSFEPVVVPGFCCIRAGFHAPVEGVPHDIIVTPKMSFGTGHHATTFQMLESMRDLDFKDRSVLDFGTGTGVLAILAEQLGAATVLAIDNDDWSMENAAENFIQNHCSRIRLQKAENLSFSERFDLVLANINKNVILANLPEMKNRLLPGGHIIISGLLTGDGPELERAIAANGLTLTNRKEKESWICWTMKA